jgi:hypothetical protein
MENEIEETRPARELCTKKTLTLPCQRRLVERLSGLRPLRIEELKQSAGLYACREVVPAEVPTVVRAGFAMPIPRA